MAGASASNQGFLIMPVAGAEQEIKEQTKDGAKSITKLGVA